MKSRKQGQALLHSRVRGSLIFGHALVFLRLDLSLRWYDRKHKHLKDFKECFKACAFALDFAFADIAKLNSFVRTLSDFTRPPQD